MDKRLNELRLNNKYPFNGVMYILDDLIHVSKIYDVIKELFIYLKGIYKDDKLFLNHDWFEHDGFVNDSREIEWNSIDVILKNEDSFYNSKDDDDEVRITIYNNCLDFILRYNLLDEDNDDECYPGKWGNFEVLCDESHHIKIEEVLRAYNVIYSKVKASEYFS